MLAAFFLSQRAGVFCGSKAQIVLELAGEVLRAGKTHVRGDGTHAQFSLAKEILALFQTDLGDVLSRRDAKMRVKQAAEIGDADMDLCSQIFQTGGAVTALRDDLQCLVHDLVFRPGGRGED